MRNEAAVPIPFRINAASSATLLAGDACLFACSNFKLPIEGWVVASLCSCCKVYDRIGLSAPEIFGAGWPCLSLLPSHAFAFW